MHNILLDPATVFSNCSDGDVRLVGGAASNEGRVEVCMNRAWGSVCNSTTRDGRHGEDWDLEEGRVVCRQLGHQELGEGTIKKIFYGVKFT